MRNLKLDRLLTFALLALLVPGFPPSSQEEASNLLSAKKPVQKPVEKKQAANLPKEEDLRKELASLEKSMQSAAQYAVSNGSVRGTSIVIYFNNTQVFDVNEVYTKNTPLSLASVTKPFTSLAVLQLAQAGSLKLSDPIANYLPDFKSVQMIDDKPITIRNLMQHTSGFPYIGARQIHAAGTKFMYSNYNYRLLSQIIEAVSKKPYSEYVQDNIFKPLGMDNAKVSRNSDGASGIMASAEDMANFASFFLNQGRVGDSMLVSPAKIKSIFKMPGFMEKSPIMQFYGLGWRVNVENSAVAMFYHTGLWDGIFADMRVLPKKKAFIIQLADPPSYRSSGFTGFHGQITALATKYIEVLEKLQQVTDDKVEHTEFSSSGNIDDLVVDGDME